MKKKHRNIVVDGVQYAWTLGYKDDESHETLVNIWKDKKIIHRVCLYEEEITPGQIATIIRELL